MTRCLIVFLFFSPRDFRMIFWGFGDDFSPNVYWLDKPITQPITPNHSNIYLTLPLRNDRRRFRTCLKLKRGQFWWLWCGVLGILSNTVFISCLICQPVASSQPIFRIYELYNYTLPTSMYTHIYIYITYLSECMSTYLKHLYTHLYRHFAYRLLYQIHSFRSATLGPTTLASSHRCFTPMACHERPGLRSWFDLGLMGWILGWL